MTQAATLDAAAGGRKLTYEEFLALEGDPHQEWVDGEAVPMVGVSELHNEITAFLISLLRLVVDDAGLGRTRSDPFNVLLGNRGRAPDVIVVLKQHYERFRTNYLEGPPDIAIEVVSPGSGATDRGAKFYEYEEAGVPEYWLIDPQREVAEFYVLDDAGHFRLSEAEPWFESVVVEGLRVKPAWFWARPAIREALAEMAAR
ncbi:MAG: Uma2 family endonuclease [Dehalococcoidia bacterium]